jgi:anaerobic selenocysteine-containing dehydrogenase
MRKEGRELVVLSPWPDTLTRRATLALTITAGYAEDFFAELRGALSAERTHASADIARFGVDTCGLARLISLLGEDRKTTVLVAPDPFGDNLQRARLAALLHGRTRSILPLGAQVNSAGALRKAGLSSCGAAVEGLSLIEAIEAGRIRALYLLGEDPLEALPEPARVRAALERLELIVCQSPFETAVTDLAHVVLPAALAPEKGGTILSLLGFESEIRPVLPLFGQSRPDREILRDLAGALGTGEAPRIHPPSEMPATTGLARSAAQDTGADGFSFRLTAVPSLFGDGLLSRQSPDLAQTRRGLRIVMNGEDFEQMGLGEREIVEVRTPNGSARAEAGHDAAVPRNLLLLRHAAGSAAGLSLIRPGADVVPAAIARIGT